MIKHQGDDIGVENRREKNLKDKSWLKDKIEKQIMMKRKRGEIMENEKKTEIKSAIEVLSLLVKLNTSNQVKPPPTSSSITTTATTPPIPIPTSVLATMTNNNNNNDDDSLEQEVVVPSIPTMPFLSLCSSILHVLDKIGPTMAVLRQDVFKNMERLEMLHATKPTEYSHLVEILKKEAVERNAKKGDTCSKALLWLTRSLDFTAALLQKIAIDPSEGMEEMVKEAYEVSFKPWHGWISATAFRVALKLIPETDTFMSLLMGKDESVDTLKDDIEALLLLLVPLLQHLHTILSSYGLEKLKSA